MSLDKYTRGPVQDDQINTEGHHWMGTVWPVEGSRGNTYEVTMVNKGFTCSCPGFAYHGKCKHIRQVVEKICSEPYYETL